MLSLRENPDRLGSIFLQVEAILQVIAIYPIRWRVSLLLGLSSIYPPQQKFTSSTKNGQITFLNYLIIKLLYLAKFGQRGKAFGRSNGLARMEIVLERYFAPYMLNFGIESQIITALGDALNLC